MLSVAKLQCVTCERHEFNEPDRQFPFPGKLEEVEYLVVIQALYNYDIEFDGPQV